MLKRLWEWIWPPAPPIEYRIRFLDVHGHCLIDMPLETMIALDQMLQRPRQLPAGYLMIERMKR